MVIMMSDLTSREDEKKNQYFIDEKLKRKKNVGKNIIKLSYSLLHYRLHTPKLCIKMLQNKVEWESMSL